MSILKDCVLELWDACFDNGSMYVHAHAFYVWFDNHSITWLFLLRIIIKNYINSYIADILLLMALFILIHIRASEAAT